ncbi:MAG: universal stress protein [Halobacteriota archaeon]
MYHSILVPTDGSPGVEGAAVRALDLARTADATVHTLYVVDTAPEPSGLSVEERDEIRQASENRGRHATVWIQEEAADLGVDAVREIREGVPHHEILGYAREFDVDLLVMGTHGRTGSERARLGSTTERVIALSEVPVMAVRLMEGVELPETGYTMYDHVVIPTDGSGAAERAAEHGLAIAERYGADVHVVYVVDTTTYGLEDAPRSIVGLLKEGGAEATEAIATEARDRNLPVTTDVLRGVPETEILNYAAGVDADLLVMGTRGRAGAPERLLGSTTARVVRRFEHPVLTVS